MAERGRPPKGVERSNLLLRIPTDLIEQVDTFKESLEAERGGFAIHRTDMLIRLIEVGLQTLTQARQPAPASPVNGQGAPAPQPPTQPAIPLALEPAPTTAPPVDVPQPAPARPRHGQRAAAMSARAIPLATLQAIAAAAAEYDKLSFAQLAQLLYERNIYRTKDPVTGQEKPLNKGTLKKWIERARTAGLLSEGRREP